MPVVHDPKPAPDKGKAVAVITADDTAVEIKNLSFRYSDGQPALSAVSLRVRRGEKVALVGPNGAGKSTLMLHLNGILTGQADELAIAGMPVSKAYLPLIRARVGLVFQNPDDQLFSPTVFEDVAFGPLHMGLPEDEVRERVARALEQVGMTTFSGRLSHHLSMGEKKRVAIATVLAMDPEILVMDEPSAGLDPRARRGLINLLRHIPLTMLVSTHDMALARDLFARMIIMDEGRIVADGPSASLLADGRLLEAHGLEAIGN
jgi:cobalt/nickel transport system ATP-binding protein